MITDTDSSLSSVADPGKGPGGPALPLRLVQTEAQRAEKFLFWRPVASIILIFLMQKVTLHFIFDASYDMMVNCNLIRQINKRHLVLFFQARNHTLFSSTKQVKSHAHMT